MAMQLIEIVNQALEAYCLDGNPKHLQEAMRVCLVSDALEKIAENERDLGIQMQPAQDEPIAWTTGFHGGYCVIRAADPAAILPIGIALYTRPQAREPLTEDERLQLRCQWIPEVHGPLTDYLIQKTEAAHGIKVEA